MPISTKGDLSAKNHATPHRLSYNEQRIMAVKAKLDLAVKATHDADYLVRQLRTQPPVAPPGYTPATDELKSLLNTSLSSLLKCVDELKAVNEVLL